MSSRMNGPGFYEFLIEAELQQYYNAFKNDLKVQNVAQLKYVSEDDMSQIGMSRPEMRRLTKYFHKHCPQTYLAKMKKKLLYRRDDSISVVSLSGNSQNVPGRSGRSVSAPGRHIIQADAIVSHKTLGSGEFGTVQQGVWTSDDGERIQVAIKCLSQDRMENNPVEFLKEAAIMHTVDHEHIVRLYGVVLDTSSLVLVTELAPLRSLLECLKEPSMRVYLTIPTLFDFCIQICDGMQYLESKRLIHRDLAARNILVFSRTKVKISDFGLSRALGVGKDYYQTNFNVNLKLPIAWCAPECINFLRFTSASDVWAYGVTLWEMFSYGFQPWAALTGQQILEAIDEPNYQRLEKPECCPNEMYYQIMLKCWQQEPHDRPTFAQLLNMLPECKPEQVQAIRESDSRSRRDLLLYDAGDIITVLDKKPLLPGGSNASSSSGDESTLLWKGVLKFGKSGLFSPANTITYLGSSLPSVNQIPNPFTRNDSRSSSMRKGRISADMISAPQNDLKHTGHIGSDGNFFGDVAFLSSKCWVPRQVVPPYKPESPNPDTSEGSSASSRFHLSHLKGFGDSQSEIPSSDTAPLLSTASQMHTDSSMQRNRRRLVLPTTNSISPVDIDTDHEYHEISDEENEIMASSRGGRSGAIGLSNPALNSESQSPLESPRFDKTFDLGPSLVDEVFGALQRDEQQPDEANVKNEMREMARQKKKFATVKPISSSDRKTLDHAIAIANELASRSMQDLDRHGKHGNNSFDDISSPRTPNSPTHRKKFSFMLGSGKNSERERRNYSQEAASIPDIQSTLSEEAKEAYNSLIDKPSLGSLGFLTPSFENKSSSFHFPEKSSSVSKKSDFFDNEPLSPPPPSSAIFQNQILPTSPTSNNPVPSTSRNPPPSVSHSRTLSSRTETEDDDVNEIEEEEEEVDANPLRLLRMNKVSNVLPLPPRERKKPNTISLSSRPTTGSYSTTSRHQRKHPLLIPGKVSIPSEISTRAPPPPPPKPLRQITISTKQLAQPETPTEKTCAEAQDVLCNSITSDEVLSNNEELLSPKSDQASVDSVFEHRSSASFSVSEMSIPLYENYETDPIPLQTAETSRNDSSDDILDEPVEKLENLAPSTPNVEVVDERRSADFKEMRRNFESRASAEVEEWKPVPKVRSQMPVPQSESPTVTARTRNLQLNLEKGNEFPDMRRSEEPASSTGYEHRRTRSKDSTYSREFRASTTPEKNSPIKETATFGFIPPRETESPFMARNSGGFTNSNRMSPSKDAPVNLSPMKIKTVQRILGSSATEQECIWALDISNGDSAHAVKLLRLKALLPESLMYEDIKRVVSVLEMSHWDVARASTFLLSNSQPPNTNGNRSSLRKTVRSDFLNANSTSTLGNGDASSTNSSRNSGSDSINSDHANSNSGGSPKASGDVNGRDYIRPTRV